MPSPGHPVISFSISFSISLPVTPSPSAYAPACLGCLPALMHFPSRHPITVHKIFICSGLILLNVGPSFFSSDRFRIDNAGNPMNVSPSTYTIRLLQVLHTYVRKLSALGRSFFFRRFGLGMDLTSFVEKAARKRILLHVHKLLTTIVYMKFFSRDVLASSVGKPHGRLTNSTPSTQTANPLVKNAGAHTYHQLRAFIVSNVAAAIIFCSEWALFWLWKWNQA